MQLRVEGEWVGNAARGRTLKIADYTGTTKPSFEGDVAVVFWELFHGSVFVNSGYSEDEADALDTVEAEIRLAWSNLYNGAS